jgi:tetratricopeptide (TPR) repeat protein
MKWKYRLLRLGLSALLSWLVVANGPLKAQAVSLEQCRKSIYQGYIAGDMASWRRGISQLKVGLAANPANASQFTYELALAQYGLIGYCIGSESCNDIDELIDSTEEMLEELLDQNERWAEVHAVLGGLYGLKIGMSPAKGIYLGPRSTRHIEKATEYGPDHPAGWIELGNARYHAPKLFGGDVEEAISCFSRAATLYESRPSLKTYSWLYLHALAWLGQSYEKAGKADQALETYRRALVAEPDFKWVRDELIPQLQRKL